MSQADVGGASSGTLGKKNLSTIHAVAQALAIGPMFSVALVLGGVSRPDIGAGWNAALAVLLAGLGVVAIAYTISLYARKYAGAGAVYEYLTHGAHPWVGVLPSGIFFVGAPLGSESGDLGLEHEPYLEALAHLTEPEIGDEEAAVDLELDEPVPGQTAQRLAYRAARDAELVCELALAEA